MAINREGTSEFTQDDPSKIGTGAIKYDGGKPAIYRGLIQYFPRALWGVAEVSTFGAQKYAWNGWSDVEEGYERYQDAKFRHALKEAMGEQNDPDSKLLHLKHEAWGALAALELYLRREESKNDTKPQIKEPVFDFMKGCIGGVVPYSVYNEDGEYLKFDGVMDG